MNMNRKVPQKLVTQWNSPMPSINGRQPVLETSSQPRKYSGTDDPGTFVTTVSACAVSVDFVDELPRCRPASC